MDFDKKQAPKWRLYTYDGTFQSNGGLWDSCPRTDLLAVVWQRPDMDKPEVELGSPYYVHAGDWIKRVWDPTLYFRKWGTVKFGRWDSPTTFDAAWRAALRSIVPPGIDTAAIEAERQSGHQCVHTSDAELTPPLPAWWVYYDDGKLFNAQHHRWAEIPTDGVMAACYSRVVDGIRISMAKRRYTYFYWTGEELSNTDDWDHLLAQHPQVKKGRITFDGLKAAMPMAEVYVKALADTLEDVPWPSAG